MLVILVNQGYPVFPLVLDEIAVVPVGAFRPEFPVCLSKGLRELLFLYVLQAPLVQLATGIAPILEVAVVSGMGSYLWFSLSVGRLFHCPTLGITCGNPFPVSTTTVIVTLKAKP